MKYIPPVIPEVAKAYQNDPRTQLAMNMLTSGSNTQPAAGGGWAWADGLARLVQGVAGGLTTKSQNKRYGSEQADLIAARQDHAAKLAGLANGVAGAVQTNPALVPQQAAPPVSGAPAMALPAQPSPVAPVAPSVASPPPGMFAPRALPGGSGMSDDPRTGGIDGNVRTAQGVASLTDPLGGRGRVTSGYGPRKAPVAGASTFHNGIDMAAPQGTPVQAAGDGVVVQAWNDTAKGGGNSVIIRHPDGTRTGYAHLAGFNVKRGDSVTSGQVIGEVGQTGRATGPHLHFTVRDASGQRIDPRTQKLSSAPVSTGAPSAQAPVAGNAPSPQELPPLPDAMAEPTAPTAAPAAQSRTLALANEMINGGNAYESSPGMAMLEKGLTEQNEMDATATKRAGDIADNVYGRKSDMFAQDRTARLNDALTARGDVRRFNHDDASQARVFGHDDTTQARGFAQQDKVQAAGFRQDMAKAGFDRETQRQILGLQFDKSLQLERMKIEAAQGTAAEKAKARITALMGTPSGLVQATKMQDVGNAAQDTIGILNEMEQINNRQSTGGLQGVPGVAAMQRWGNKDLQTFHSLEEKLRIASSKLLPGAVSDKEGAAILASGPSTGNLHGTNADRIALTRAVAQRNADYAQRYISAMADGTFPQFMSTWGKYRNAVPSTSGVSYDDWLAKGSTAAPAASGKPTVSNW